MKKMRVALLEDVPQDKDYFINTLAKTNLDVEVEWFQTMQALLQAETEGNPFDIAFLDIQINDDNHDGIDAAVALKEISPKSKVVFLTSSKDYAIQAFSLNAVHYIMKPIQKEQLEEVFLRIDAELKKPDVITIRIDREDKLINCEDIMYIRADDHYIIFVLEDGQELQTYYRISDIEQELNGDFLRVQRGIIIHLRYVQSMKNGRVLMRNGVEFLLSRQKRKEIQQIYHDYLFTQLEASSNIEIV